MTKQEILEGIKNTLDFGLDTLFEDFDTITREELEAYLQVSLERIEEWLE